MARTRYPIAMQLASMFGVVVFLLLAVLGYALYYFKIAGDEAEKIVTQTSARLILVKTAHNDFTRALLDMRGFLFYPDGMATYEKGYRDNIARSLKEVSDLKQATVYDDVRKESEKLEKYIATYIEYADKRLIPARKANDPNWLPITTEGRQMVKDIDTTFIALSEMQKNHLDEQGLAVLKSSQDRSNMASVASVLILVLVIIIVVRYSRNMAWRLQRVSTALTQVGSLNLSEPDLVPTRNDEIADMAACMTNMKHSLKDIVSNISGNSQTLAASSEELSASVNEQLRAVEMVANSVTEIAAGSSRNADSISTISATLQEISASSEEISAGAVEVNHSAEDAVTEAGRGMQLLQEVVKQNEYISQSMQEITSVTGKLAQGSDEIRGIVDVINSIAAQTNLLALNAAIEAARAGEAGRGFAVVAEEVRKLAEQSADATKDIARIIQNMGAEIDFAVTTVEKANQEVDKGKHAADNTQTGFQSIIAKLDLVKERIEHISIAVNETATGTQSAVSSVETISHVAQDTSANAETVAASAEEQTAGMNEINANANNLAALASDLREIVRRFKM